LPSSLTRTWISAGHCTLAAPAAVVSATPPIGSTRLRSTVIAAKAAWVQPTVPFCVQKYFAVDWPSVSWTLSSGSVQNE